ncbi:hypothetical protein CEUSTIGMA_g364.t1 [Chlamydomonas eustigma]|uniref:ERD4-related membrane protein n=1 Tax=Chlamydomonas eustigma TaxID=1157962 RepID=A0A250WQE1_9CHLO|nr:hypothetical protein CEUSTIGMA_g364.t1 [Chlamydomonas eustigma]|eukprot:GAX72909.1 hypothetical protein CEUSTIGMA_g364.t1 [Chlamydomonas eustigma]
MRLWIRLFMYFLGLLFVCSAVAQSTQPFTPMLSNAPKPSAPSPLSAPNFSPYNSTSAPITSPFLLSPPSAPNILPSIPVPPSAPNPPSIPADPPSPPKPPPNHPPSTPPLPPEPHPPPKPGPPIPPFPPPNFDQYFGTSNILSDDNLTVAAYINGALFVIIVLIFVLLQSRSILFKFRLVSPSVACKPPAIPNGAAKFWAWFLVALTVSDADLLETAGLDALIFIKMWTLGIQVMLPMAILGCCVLVPINTSSGYIDLSIQNSNNAINPSKFMRWTMTNVDSSNILWVHFFMVLIFTAYACWVLQWHYHQFVVIKHHYMIKGDGVNLLRNLEEQERDAEKQLSEKLRNMRSAWQSTLQLALGRSLSKVASGLSKLRSNTKGDMHSADIPGRGLQSTKEEGGVVGKTGSHVIGISSMGLHPRSGLSVSMVTEATRAASKQSSSTMVSPMESNTSPSKRWVSKPTLRRLKGDESIKYPQFQDNPQLRDKQASEFLRMIEDDWTSTAGVSLNSNEVSEPLGRPSLETMSRAPINSLAAVSRLEPAPQAPIEDETSNEHGAGKLKIPAATQAAGHQGSIVNDRKLMSDENVVDLEAGHWSFKLNMASGATANCETTDLRQFQGHILQLPVGQVQDCAAPTDVVVSTSAADAGGVPDACGGISSKLAEEAEHLDWSTDEITELPRWWGHVEYKYCLNEEIKFRQKSTAVFRTPIMLAKSIKDLTQRQTEHLLSQPSVRFRKTINAVDSGGELVTVYAQRYAVLVTDVNQDPLQAGKTLWKVSNSSPGEWLLSCLIPRMFRHYIFHNYSSSIFPVQPIHWSEESFHEEEEGHGGSICLHGVQHDVEERAKSRVTPGGGTLTRPEAATATLVGVQSMKTRSAVEYMNEQGGLPASDAVLICALDEKHHRDVQDSGPLLAEAVDRLGTEPSRADMITGDPDEDENTGREVLLAPAHEAMISPGQALCEGKELLDQKSDMTSEDPAQLVHVVMEMNSAQQSSETSSSTAVHSFPRDPVSGRRILRPGSYWQYVQQAVRVGKVADLLDQKSYSVVTSTFRSLFPDDFDRAVPVINHKEVDLLLMQLDLVMWRYEIELTQFKQSGVRATFKSGWCGLYGPKVDLMDLYRKQMIDLQEKIREARMRALKEGSTPSWFVFFKTQRAAIVASQTILHSEDHREFKVSPAPGPEEVNWAALWMSHHDQTLRTWMMRTLLGITIIIPIGIFGASLMQLELLVCPLHYCQDPMTGAITITSSQCPDATYLIPNGNNQTFDTAWPWYCDGKNNGQVVAKSLFAILTGWVPALLSSIWFGMLIPLISYLCLQGSGYAFSLSHLDVLIAHWIWGFVAFNQFLGGVIGATVASQVQTIFTAGPLEAIIIMGNYLPSSSVYFINMLCFRCLVGIPLRMIMPHPAARFYLIRRWFRFTSAPLTERDKAFLYQPCSIRYAFEVGVLLSTYLIGFSFAVVSPMVTLAAVCCFVMGWMFWRYAVLYIFIRKYESGGMMWPFLFSCILAMLVIMAVFTACTMIVKKAFAQAILLIMIVPFGVMQFREYCVRRFEKGIEALPLQAAITAPPAHVEPSVYIPSPLNKKALGWNPEWSKPWSGWGLPPYGF